MTVINKQPRKAGKYAVTEIVDSVGTSEETYSFLNSTVQEQLQIFNTGNKTLVVSVGTQTNVSIAPFETQTFNESFTQFKIKTLSGFSSFRMVSLDQVVLDETELQSKLDAITNSGGANHTHSNMSTLNKLTDNGINLLFNGSPIVSGGGGSLPVFQELAAGEVVALLTGGAPTIPTDPPAADTTAPTITISTIGGTYTGAQTVTLTPNETATIYYTLDGTEPTTSSSVYSSALTISANTTLKYFGKDSAGNTSAVQTQTYTIDIPAAAWVTDGLVTKWNNLTTQTSLTDDGTYYDGSKDFTVVATFKPKAYMNLLSQYAIGQTNAARFYVDSTAQRPQMQIWGTNSAGTSVQPAIGTDKAQIMTDATAYYHVAFVKDATNVTMYVNNVLYATVAHGGITLNNSTQPIKIGEPSSDIKTMIYYNRALTTAELTQNYNALK